MKTINHGDTAARRKSKAFTTEREHRDNQNFSMLFAVPAVPPW